MREELGVRIDFSDIELATSAPTVNKKKPARAKAQVTVKGRRANAEEAKRRILSQADRVVRYFASSRVSRSLSCVSGGRSGDLDPCARWC